LAIRVLLLLSRGQILILRLAAREVAVPNDDAEKCHDVAGDTYIYNNMMHACRMLFTQTHHHHHHLIIHWKV